MQPAIPLGARGKREGVEWTHHAIGVLGGEAPARIRRVHPRVRRLLHHLHENLAEEDASLEALAAIAELSPGRLMHAFTTSIGIPLRPYLLWLRAQRAAGAILSGAPLSEAAYGAGFADSAHMSRTFRRMFGITPNGVVYGSWPEIDDHPTNWLDSTLHWGRHAEVESPTCPRTALERAPGFPLPVPLIFLMDN